MMIRLTQSTVVKGCPGVIVGDVINVPDNVARDLIAFGVGVEFKPEAKTEPAVIETREPAVETRDPEPKRKVKSGFRT